MKDRQLKQIFSLWKDGVSKHTTVESVLSLCRSQNEAAKAIITLFQMIEIHQRLTEEAKTKAIKKYCMPSSEEMVRDKFYYYLNHQRRVSDYRYLWE